MEKRFVCICIQVIRMQVRYLVVMLYLTAINLIYSFNFNYIVSSHIPTPRIHEYSTYCVQGKKKLRRRF